MKKFTINCDFGGQMSPFTIFIGEPELEHHPLHFQADWLSKQRNGTIPSQVMDAIAKLKELADKNNVSLEELCVYALGSVGADESGAAAEGEGEFTANASEEQIPSTETISAEEAGDIVEVQSNEIIDNQAPAMDDISAEDAVSDATQIAVTIDIQVDQQAQKDQDNVVTQEENVDNQLVDKVTIQENTNLLPQDQLGVADNNIVSEQQNLVNTEQNEEPAINNEQQQEAIVDPEKKQ